MSRHADDLKRQIERILRWEPSEYWQPRDFAHLSEQIMAHTNGWVEAHDLQTFWRTSVATPGLLDALAQFADYADWPDFCARNRVGEMVPIKPDVFHAPMWDVPARWVPLIWLLSAAAALGLGALLVWKR